MNKSFYLVLSLTVILILNACSSVKVLNSWKADNVNTIHDKNIIVIARTDNNQARIAFENEIVRQLTERGMKATASFTKFPKINPDQKITEEKRKMIKSILISEGFNAVILTVIKDLQETTKVETDGGYYAGGTNAGFYPMYYRGFYGYYYNRYSYSTYGNYVPRTFTTQTQKTFVLETVAYNLDNADNEQLVAVVTSEIKDPKDVYLVAEEYVKAITKSFDKK